MPLKHTLEAATKNSVQPLASPPGTPDDFDLERIAGWQSLDPVTLLNKQRIRRSYFAVALAIWAVIASVTLIAFVFTGLFPFLAMGYAVTLPYLFACYKYRALSDSVDELALYCRMDGC